MASERSGAVQGQFRTLFNVGAFGGPADARLLERFAAGGDAAAELAFAALVERHGPMVLRTCRSVLRDDHDAQDAFQATFLVLARKAGTLRVRGSLGPWLHAVAARVALASRSARLRRRTHERRAAEMAATRESGRVGDDLGSTLHEELGRLPDRFRAALVLCGLEGLTQQQAAEQLGWPLGTLQSRLARGRERLRLRLIRRGLAPPTVLLAVGLLEKEASAALPPSAIEATARAAARIAAGGIATGISPGALALATQMQRSFLMNKLRIVAGGLLAAGVVIGGVVLIHGAEADGPPADPQPPRAAPAEEVPIVRTLEHGEQILGVAFSPDGKALASAGNGGGALVKVWSTRTGKMLHKLGGAWVGWRSVAFSPDGKRLVAVGDAGNGRRADKSGGEPFRLWDAETGELSWKAAEIDPPAEFLAVAYSPDGKTLAVGGRSGALFRGFNPKIGVLRLHDSRTGDLIRDIPGIDDVWALAFSPDGKTLAVGTNSNGRVLRFDAETWTLKDETPISRPTSLAFSPDGETLAVGQLGPAGQQGSVTLIDQAGGAEPRGFATQPESILSVAFSPDGKHLATGGYDKTARVYHVETGALERKRTLPNWGNAVAFSPDGSLLAIGTSPAVLLWNWGADAAPPEGDSTK